ncbi:MAG: DUF3789 domain-containing protein [Lachnospiraceae bacterium]|nr:DUF3789 domain-containing protein [Lachnospiraceae bacterium]
MLWGLIGFIIGTITGVVIMCLLQIHRMKD